jgi:hypothetical protein
MENMQRNLQNMQNLQTLPKICKKCTPQLADGHGPVLNLETRQVIGLEYE